MAWCVRSNTPLTTTAPAFWYRSMSLFAWSWLYITSILVCDLTFQGLRTSAISAVHVSLYDMVCEVQYAPDHNGSRFLVQINVFVRLELALHHIDIGMRLNVSGTSHIRDLSGACESL